MPIRLDRSRRLIALEGSIDITVAAEFRAVLLEALTADDAMQVSLQPTTDLDVTALQLLCAAEREARSRGKRLTLAGTVPETVLTRIREAGLAQFPLKTEAE